MSSAVRRAQLNGLGLLEIIRPQKTQKKDVFPLSLDALLPSTAEAHPKPNVQFIVIVPQAPDENVAMSMSSTLQCVRPQPLADWMTSQDNQNISDWEICRPSVVPASPIDCTMNNNSVRNNFAIHHFDSQVSYRARARRRRRAPRHCCSRFLVRCCWPLSFC